MNKYIFSILFFASSVAFATSGGEGNNTNCNGKGNPNSPCVGKSSNSNNTNNNTNTINSYNKTYRYDTTDNSIKNTNTSNSNAFSSSNNTNNNTAEGGFGLGIGVGGNSNSSSTGGSSSVGNVSSTSYSAGGQGGAGGNAQINYNVPETQHVYNHSDGEVTVKNTPDVVAPNVTPTAPCIIPVSAGIGIPGFGGSVGGYAKDLTCTAMEIRRTTTNSRIIQKADRFLENELDDMLLGQAKRKEGRIAREESAPFGY